MIHKSPRTAFFTVLSIAIAAAADDWPSYRGPHYDGVSTERLPVNAWPASGPSRLWKVPTPDGFSSFAVAGGSAFTLVTRNVDGANLETVVALNAENGTERWAHPLRSAKYDDGGDSGADGNAGGDGPRSTPAVDGDRLYVLDAKLMLVALETATGREVWHKDIVAEHKGRNISWQSAASPLVEGSLVFVAGGGPGESLLGIDKADGHTVWKGENETMTHSTPTVANLLGERQVIFFAQSGLVAVRPGDGKVQWRQTFLYKVSTAASPVVEGDIVYCSAGYGVGAGAYRISRDGDGFKSTELWRQPGKLQNHWSTPVAYQGHLYGMFGFKEYGKCPLKCVELATGKEKWSQEGFGPGNVSLVGGQLVVLGDAGQVALVDAAPDGYREKARADVLDGKCWSSPAYAGGRIYVRSTKEGVCLDLNARVAAR